MKTESAIIIGLKIPPVPQAFCDFISQIGGQKFREVSDLTKVTQRLSGSTGDSSPGQRASPRPHSLPLYSSRAQPSPPSNQSMHQDPWGPSEHRCLDLSP